MMERTAAARDDLLTPARRNGAWRSCYHEGGTEGAGGERRGDGRRGGVEGMGRKEVEREGGWSEEHHVVKHS